jgi:hypothetical protein
MKLGIPWIARPRPCGLRRKSDSSNQIIGSLAGANAANPTHESITTVDITDPDSSKGALKDIGGSQSDHWNIYPRQVAQTLWIKHSDRETRDR